MSNFGVFFEITDLCNHECIHCCKTWRKDSGLTMSKEMIEPVKPTTAAITSMPPLLLGLTPSSCVTTPSTNKTAKLVAKNKRTRLNMSFLEMSVQAHRLLHGVGRSFFKQTCMQNV